MSAPLVVGVDGGNSKTDVVLARADGEILAAVRGPGSSPHRLGLEGALQVVDGLVAAAWNGLSKARRNGNGPPAAAGVFMAGADLPHEEQALRQAVRRRGWAERSHVDNDVFALLWAGTGAGWGVAVTAGAGVNGVGRAPSGADARFPALGAITGDYGGGYGIGLDALGAAVRAEDRRGPDTALRGAIAGLFSTSTALDVAVAIHEQRLDLIRLQDIAPLVVEAAQADDQVAVEILDRQADEVIGIALGAIRQLQLHPLGVDVVLGGSLMIAIAPLVFERIRTGVCAEAQHARVQLCTTAPVLGATLAALHAAGAPPAAAHRLRDRFAGTELRAITL